MPSYTEVEYLKALWDLEDAKKQYEAFVSEIRERVNARKRLLGLPEPGQTAVPTLLRTGAMRGVFEELTVGEAGEFVRLTRVGVRAGLGSSRVVQKVAYRAALRPEQVLPDMLKQMASLVPESVRVEMARVFLAELGYGEDVLRKVETVLKKG